MKELRRNQVQRRVDGQHCLLLSAGSVRIIGRESATDVPQKPSDTAGCRATVSCKLQVTDSRSQACRYMYRKFLLTWPLTLAGLGRGPAHRSISTPLIASSRPDPKYKTLPRFSCRHPDMNLNLC